MAKKDDQMVSTEIFMVLFNGNFSVGYRHPILTNCGRDGDETSIFVPDEVAHGSKAISKIRPMRMSLQGPGGRDLGTCAPWRINREGLLRLKDERDIWTIQVQSSEHSSSK